MTEDDIEEVMQIYDGFIKIVQQLSMPAKEQIKKRKGTVVADEIALDFCEIGMIYAKKLFEVDWITREQFEAATEIGHDFSDMSSHKELWDECALMHAKEWEKCREKGRRLLSTLC